MKENISHGIESFRIERHIEVKVRIRLLAAILDRGMGSDLPEAQAGMWASVSSLSVWKSFAYRSLPQQPLKLSVHKLDGSCFGKSMFSHDPRRINTHKLYICACKSIQLGTYDISCIMKSVHACVLYIIMYEIRIYFRMYTYKNIVNLDAITINMENFKFKQSCLLQGRQQQRS